jgi:ABC-type xylose transport system permease subunit
MSCYLNQKIMKSELVDRIKSPTPTFFKKIRTVGLTLGAIGGAILTAPITLPATIITIAGYLATAGMVASAISTVAKEDRTVD